MIKSLKPHKNHRVVLRPESNFDRMKRRRKRRELITDIILIPAMVCVMLLFAAMIATLKNS